MTGSGSRKLESINDLCTSGLSPRDNLAEVCIEFGEDRVEKNAVVGECYHIYMARVFSGYTST